MEVTEQGSNEITIAENGGDILPPAEDGEAKLSERELEEFREDCETIINELGSFMRVGMALRRIKRKKLYREDYKTFEACVRALFDLSARRSRQLMQASEAMDLLGAEIKEKRKNFSAFETGALPKNEGQVLALLAAPKEKRADIWLKTLESADGKPTARKIKEIIHQEGVAKLKKQAEKVGQSLKDKQNKSGKELHKPFEDALNAFMGQITDAYMDNWQQVPKQEVVRHLQSIIDYIKIH